MGRNGQRPKAAKNAVTGVARLGEDPTSYLKQRPAWHFWRFDWEGSWGVVACRTANWRNHIEQHLAAFERMTWGGILEASGGKREGHGNNSHPIPRDHFTRTAQRRLEDKQIYADDLFSLRLQQTIRIYGVRNGYYLEIVWFDPYHERGNKKAAYDWG
jgi:hypothetical protein